MYDERFEHRRTPLWLEHEKPIHQHPIKRHMKPRQAAALPASGKSAYSRFSECLG